MVHHTLHVVRKHILRDAHVPESVQHSNEQVLLLCVREELDKRRPTMVAAHGKASSLVLVSGAVQDLCKAPVHMKRFSGSRLISPSPVALRLHQMPLGGYKVLMCGNIDLYCCLPAVKACCLKPFQTNNRIRDAVHKQRVKQTCIAGETSLRGYLSRIAMRFEHKAVTLQPPKPSSAYATSALQLGQIQLLKAEPLSHFRFHFLDCLVNAGFLLLII